jgi:hypothetical protein
MPASLRWRHYTKSRQYIYGSSIKASAEAAGDARRQANELACVAWNQRMLGYKGPAQTLPTLGGALNAGFGFLSATATMPTRRSM